MVFGAFTSIFAWEFPNYGFSVEHSQVYFIGTVQCQPSFNDSISFGKLERKSLTITSRLPANTSYLFRGTSQSLDNSVLILSELDSMYHHYGWLAQRKLQKELASPGYLENRVNQS